VAFGNGFRFPPAIPRHPAPAVPGACIRGLIPTITVASPSLSFWGEGWGEGKGTVKLFSNSLRPCFTTLHPIDSVCFTTILLRNGRGFAYRYPCNPTLFMKIDALRIGQRVKHLQYGMGTVRALTEHTADVRFDDGSQRTLAPETSGIEAAEAQAQLTALSMPLAAVIKATVESTVESLGLERAQSSFEKLGSRWYKGRMVLHPGDPTLQTKELDIEVFFHKIVMMRNNLRVLEQKINGDDKLTEAEKIERQQYITRCYGSMTTFNILFKEKEDQF